MRGNLKEAGGNILRRSSAKAVENHVSPGEMNPIEGKFGQAINGYVMNRIRARFKNNRQSWIAYIILVLNLVKLALAGMELMCLSFSAWKVLKRLLNIGIELIHAILKSKN